jgi:hypothetical protein
MPSRYEFVLRGRIDRTSVPALAGFTRTTRGDFVVFRGDLDSDQGLADVLGQFAALGLGLHAVRELPDDGPDAPL